MTQVPAIRRIAAADYQTQPWRNGMGTTREIVRHPQQGEWDWRLSIARIDADSAFSQFPGVDRHLLLLRGNGVRLRFADGEVCELAPPHGGAAFAGEREVTGELVDGPTEDFNVMWRRARVSADCWLRPLVGDGVLAQAAQEQWAIHLLAGSLAWSDAEAVKLDAGDTALIDQSPQRRTLRYRGEGMALFMRFRPVAQTDT